MAGKILLITSSYDKTCNYIMSKYSHLDFFRFDLDCFSKYRVSFSSSTFEIKSSDNSAIDSESCLSIYFRKPSMENLEGIFDSKYHTYVHRETYSFVEGIAESFNGPVLTKPSIMRRANNKIFQACLASESGFVIPKYAITNENSWLEHFTKEQGIIKPVATGEILTGTQKEFVQTNLIDSSFDSGKIAYSPVYLQTFIGKDYEVRVTVIGRQVFPVKIYSQNKVDWRKPKNIVHYESCDIPSEIEQKCFSFMKRCNMQFGCFDFIVNDDKWHFLEMNANGQWAWLEFEVGLNMSGAIVDILTQGKER